MIKIHHENEPAEEVTCEKCGGELFPCPMELKNGVVTERSIFAYAITHKKDGTPIKDLDTKGAFLGILELGWCGRCEKHSIILDSMDDDPKGWAKLPKWEREI